MYSRLAESVSQSIVAVFAVGNFHAIDFFGVLLAGLFFTAQVAGKLAASGEHGCKNNNQQEYANQFLHNFYSLFF